MAKDKISFLFYTDWGIIFDSLTEEESGRLIKHLLDYVRDKNPEAPDRMTKLLFDPIKLTLKRDLVKYEQIREKNRDNVGKRWNKKDTTVYDRKKANTKNTVRDRVRDRVSVRETVKEEYKYLFSDDRFNSAWETLLTQPNWKKKTVNAYNLSLKKCHEWGISKSISAIETTIENNWAGLFEPKEQFKSKPDQPIRREVNPREYNPADYKVVDYGK